MAVVTLVLRCCKTDATADTDLIAVEDLGDASVRDAQLTTDDTRTNAVGCHLHDLQSNVIGKRATIDEDATQLIDPSLT